MPVTLYIDADACPVKEEVYRVARRYGLKVFVVSNAWINVPREALIEQVVVDAGPDVADDWIAERAATGDIVVTADIPLADRCLKSGAQALKSNGQPLTPSARPWPGAWWASICAPSAWPPAARRPSRTPTARVSCKPWTRRSSVHGRWRRESHS